MLLPRHATIPFGNAPGSGTYLRPLGVGFLRMIWWRDMVITPSLRSFSSETDSH